MADKAKPWRSLLLTASYCIFMRRITFLFLFKKRSISEWYFPKNREIGSLVVRPWEKFKKSRESRQNRELGQACGVEEQLLISSSYFIISPGRVKDFQKFINFCLKVGHSANLKHSKSTIRKLILLWKLQNHNALCTLSTSLSRGHRGDVWERSIYDNCRFDIGCFCASRLITKVSTPEWDICISQCPLNNSFLTLSVIHELKRGHKNRQIKLL